MLGLSIYRSKRASRVFNQISGYGDLVPSYFEIKSIEFLMKMQRSTSLSDDGSPIVQSNPVQ
jgi:hypothetical protein